MSFNWIKSFHTEDVQLTNIVCIQLEIQTNTACKELSTNGYIMIFHKLRNFYLNHIYNHLLYQLDSVNIL